MSDTHFRGRSIISWNWKYKLQYEIISERLLITVIWLKVDDLTSKDKADNKVNECWGFSAL